MSASLSRVSVGELDEVLTALGSWQRDGLPIQLHPGDLGWHGRFGASALADALRMWRDGDRIIAVGFFDGDDLIRLGISPDVDTDRDVATRLADDLTDPGRGLLVSTDATIEARLGTALRRELDARGWVADEPWTPLVRDLTDPVEDVGLDIRSVGADEVDDRIAVQRSAFPRSTFSPERWRTMTEGPAFRQARDLVGYDATGTAVAVVTVWSAGEGRPGLIEPFGVHRDARGQGYGRAITLAAAAALRDLGSSSASVVTSASNVGGVRTDVSAGFTALPDVTDFRRPGPQEESSGDATQVIFTLSVDSDRPIHELADFAGRRREPRPDDDHHYAFGHVSFLDADASARADRLDAAIHEALDRLEGTGVDPAVLAHPDVLVRAFFTFGVGAETISAEAVQRLARVHATIWIDASE